MMYNLWDIGKNVVVLDFNALKAGSIFWVIQNFGLYTCIYIDAKDTYAFLMTFHNYMPSHAEILMY